MRHFRIFIVWLFLDICIKRKSLELKYFSKIQKGFPNENQVKRTSFSNEFDLTHFFLQESTLFSTRFRPSFCLQFFEQFLEKFKEKFHGKVSKCCQPQDMS